MHLLPFGNELLHPDFIIISNQLSQWLIQDISSSLDSKVIVLPNNYMLHYIFDC